MEKEKPFECVGSRDEVNAAISLTIDRMMGQEKDLKKLPGLFRYYVLNGLYRENDPASGRFFRYFDEENLLPERYLDW